ncbi:MAG: hypothetical protein LBL99_03325 [Holosporaceae bacterium]|jgi:putative ABC transport system permease protein|nr:hypothetical protein [Holosporaceae bacterium]
MIDSIINVFSMSLAFALIGLNVYLSTKVLNITDITCDASVALGGCSYGALVVSGINPLVSFLIAVSFGVFAGFMTASIVSHIKVDPALASIITLVAMQTFITKLALIEELQTSKTFLTSVSAAGTFLLTLVVALAVTFLFFRMLNSEYGLAMRVNGGGQIISESLGIDSANMLWIGLGVANGLSALAGALITQISHSFSSIMGDGALVFGLAAVIIGETIIPPKTVRAAITGCFAGAFIYKTLIGAVMFSGAEIIGAEYHGIIISVALIFLMASLNDRKRLRGLL